MPHRVLLLDDSPDIHDLVRFGLLGEPLELRACEKARVGLAMATEWMPDLLLLDVDMPDIDGFEVCRRLKADKTTAGIQIVFLTGASSVSEKLRGLELGAIDYVTKPFDPVELRARVRSAIRTTELMNRLASETENLRASSQVLRLIAQDSPIEDVQKRLIEMAEREYPGSSASIVLLRHGQLEHTAPSFSPELRAAFERRLVRFTSGLCSSVASRGELFCQSMIATDPAWSYIRSEILQAGYVACWHVLISSAGGDVLGMFAMYHHQPLVAGDAAKLFFEQMASLLSIAAEHAQLTEQLEHRTQHDALTGLSNRLIFDNRLAIAIMAARAGGHSVGIVFVDVDRFKTINDTFGHLVGDMLLCQLSERLLAAVGDAGMVARLGGDEFAMVLDAVHDRVQAVRVGQRILEAFKAPLQLGDHELFVTVSIGLSLFPEDGQDIVTLQKNADVAMYRAKHGGRNAFQCFDRGMDATLSKRLEIEHALRSAIANGQLSLAYQPQVNGSGDIVAVEALLRWCHPTHGNIPPGEFIPVAEECGLIVPIGDWVIREAAAQWKRWNEMGLGHIRIAVNVSALQFACADFVDAIYSTLKSHGMPTQCMELELTESLLMKNPAETAMKLTALKSMGHTLAIDDFGTGYSSLAHLQRLPFDTLKIDRSFVMMIDSATSEASDKSDTAVIRAIVSMSKSMNKTVVAEGVETEFQRHFLTELGCDLFQGYLFAKPMRAEDIPKLLGSAMELFSGRAASSGADAKAA